MSSVACLCWHCLIGYSVVHDERSVWKWVWHFSSGLNGMACSLLFVVLFPVLEVRLEATVTTRILSRVLRASVTGSQCAGLLPSHLYVFFLHFHSNMKKPRCISYFLCLALQVTMPTSTRGREDDPHRSRYNHGHGLEMASIARQGHGRSTDAEVHTRSTTPPNVIGKWRSYSIKRCKYTSKTMVNRVNRSNEGWNFFSYLEQWSRLVWTAVGLKLYISVQRYCSRSV